MKAPTALGFARLAMRLLRSLLKAAGEKMFHTGIFGMVPQLLRVAARDHGAAAGVEKDTVVGDRENTRQIMPDHHDRRTETVTEFKNQFVKPPRAYWIQAGRRLIKE